MINSRFPLVSATHTRSRQQVPITLKVPLVPKLRGHFAEFLNHDSLDRLSILYLITCVGLGYGRLKPHADAFLGSIGSPNPPKTGSHHVSGTQPAHLTTDNPTRLDHDNHRVAWLPSCVTPVNTFTSKDRVPQPTQGVSPYTSSYDFARTCVFDKQSLPPGLCDPYTLQAASAHHAQGPPCPEVTGAFCRVP